MSRQEIVNAIMTFLLTNSDEYWATFSDEEVVGFYNTILTLKKDVLQAKVDEVNTSIKAIADKTLLPQVQSAPVGADPFEPAPAPIGV